MFPTLFALVLAVSASQDTFYPTRPVGIADIVAFGSDGTYILRNSINPVVRLATTDYGSNGGWVTERHLRFVADATGDGNADVIAFGERNVFVSQNNGKNGFGSLNVVLSNFVETTGWALPTNPRVVADLRKKGRVDLLGFGNDGVYVSLNNGNLDFTNIFWLSTISALLNFGHPIDIYVFSRMPTAMASLISSGLAIGVFLSVLETESGLSKLPCRSCLPLQSKAATGL